MSKQKKDRSDWDLTQDATDDIIDQNDAEEERDALTPDEAKGNPNANDDRPPGEEDDEQ